MAPSPKAFLAAEPGQSPEVSSVWTEGWEPGNDATANWALTRRLKEEPLDRGELLPHSFRKDRQSFVFRVAASTEDFCSDDGRDGVKIRWDQDTKD